MENANDNFNIINGKDNGDHKEGLEKFKVLLKKIKEYGTGVRTPKPKKILIATDADACLFRGYVSNYAGALGLGVMSDMVYVYRNIFKLCKEAGIECDFCFYTVLQPYQCNPFFKEQLSERLGKDKDGKPFIRPEDIHFAPYNGGTDKDIEHKNFNNKMFGDNNGYENTEVLYFDNDLDGKIYRFQEKFNKKLKEKKLKDRIKFPVNIIHTEDVKNWITGEENIDDIVKKRLGKEWENQGKIGNKEGYINKMHPIWLPEFEQKTGKREMIDNKLTTGFNKDGLKVSDLLSATQDALFENKSELKEKQNEWIKQNFKTDKFLADKLFDKYSLELDQLEDQTMQKCAKNSTYENEYNELASEMTEKMREDTAIKGILDEYPTEPESVRSVDTVSMIPDNSHMYKVVNKKVPKIERTKGNISYKHLWLGKNYDDKVTYDEVNHNKVVVWKYEKGRERNYVSIERGGKYKNIDDGILISNERADVDNKKPSVTEARAHGNYYKFFCK